MTKSIKLDNAPVQKRKLKLKLTILLILSFVIVVIFIPIFCRSVRLLWLIEPYTTFPLNLKWQTDLGNATYELPAYEAELVIIPSQTLFDTYWYGLKGTTGQIVWSQQYQKAGFRRCLTEQYLVISGAQNLSVLNTQTGEFIWEKDVTATRASCSQNAIFYTGVPRDSINAVDISTGHGLWSAEKSFNGLVYDAGSEKIIASQAIAPEDLYVIQPESGELLNSFKEVGFVPTNNSWSRGPLYLVDRGQLFIGGTVLDTKTGRVIHEENHYNTAVPPLVTPDKIYISNRGAVALDRTTFDVQWQYQPPSKLDEVTWFPNIPRLVELSSLSPIVILDGVGYVILSDISVRAFDLKTGQEVGYWQPNWFDLWRSPLCDVPVPIPGCSLSARPGLAVSNDTLFVSFGDGKVYAFER